MSELQRPTKRVAAFALVTDDAGRVLLIEHPVRGWEIPGGHVEDGESAPEAAKRECLEEAGVHVEIGDFAGVFQFLDEGLMCLCFVGSASGGDAKGQPPESLDARFFSLEEANAAVRWYDRRCIELTMGGARAPFFDVHASGDG